MIPTYSIHQLTNRGIQKLVHISNLMMMKNLLHLGEMTAIPLSTKIQSLRSASLHLPNMPEKQGKTVLPVSLTQTESAVELTEGEKEGRTCLTLNRPA